MSDSFDIVIDGGTSTFNITLVNAVTSSSATIEAGGRFTFDGTGGDTYLTYNAGTARLELYVDGVMVQEW
jgi:hypothetical protein